MNAPILAGKTAVVTGAAGPLGLAAARGLLEDGAQVALVDVDAMRLDGLIRFLRGTTVAVPGDVTDADAVRQACAQVEKLLGPTDILVNAASLQSTTRAEATSDEEWRRALAVNLEGVFFWTRAVLPMMKKRSWGRIISVGPLAQRGGPGVEGVAYAASRGALRAYTVSLARETAAHGVTVNAIAPAYVNTPSISEQMNEAQRRQLLTQVPAARFCEPEEFAHAVRFLAAPLAGFVTGQVLEMNGGAALP